MFAGENKSLLDYIGEKIKNGKVPNTIYNSPEIFELEKERIFGKAWVFVAHESEIPNPGDYVVRNIVDDSFIVTRSDDKKVRVFLNVCLHRGMELCRSEMGHGRSFRCPYHGFTYNNTGELLGIPWDKFIYYPDGLDKGKSGLMEAPKMDIYNNMIFVCLDPDAVPLRTYLGNMVWYLDLLTARSAEGMEVSGPPQRWVVDADWKIASENLSGDSYHTPFSHKSAPEVGLQPFQTEDFSPGKRKDGAEILTDCGTVGFTKTAPGTFFGYPQEIVASLKKNLKPDQVKLLEGGPHDGYFPVRAHVFPNLSFLNVAAFIEPNKPPVHYLTIRVWQPVGPGKIEIVSWNLVEKDAPAWLKRQSPQAYAASFGSSGMLEQDDAENWISISKTAKGTLGKKMLQHLQMGMTNERLLQDWPGPGKAYGTVYTEAGQRYFLEMWHKYLKG